MKQFLLVFTILFLFSHASWSAIVINEVQPNPRQTTNKIPYQWFEIYNSGSSPVTLDRWEIWNRAGMDIIPTVTVPAKGFVVVAASSAFLQNYPNFQGIVVYMQDGTIGNGLQDGYSDPNHFGDLLVIKDASGQVVDALNWGNVDSSWPNYALAPWNPGAVVVPANHGLGRRPDGNDSNQPGDFVSLNPATPGASNPLQTGPLPPTTWGKIKALYSDKYRQLS